MKITRAIMRFFRFLLSPIWVYFLWALGHPRTAVRLGIRSTLWFVSVVLLIVAFYSARIAIDYEQIKCDVSMLDGEDRFGNRFNHRMILLVTHNRVASHDFPNTSCEVIFEKGQYSYLNGLTDAERKKMVTSWPEEKYLWTFVIRAIRARYGFYLEGIPDNLKDAFWYKRWDNKATSLAGRCFFKQILKPVGASGFHAVYVKRKKPLRFAECQKKVKKARLAKRKHRR